MQPIQERIDMLGQLFLPASPHYGVFIYYPAHITGFSFNSSLVVRTTIQHVYSIVFNDREYL